MKGIVQLFKFTLIFYIWNHIGKSIYIIEYINKEISLETFRSGRADPMICQTKHGESLTPRHAELLRFTNEFE